VFISIFIGNFLLKVRKFTSGLANRRYQNDDTKLAEFQILAEKSTNEIWQVQ
jgi:hypothetical protein